MVRDFDFLRKTNTLTKAKILQTNKRQSDNPIKFAANPVLSLPLLRNGRIHNFII